MNEGKLSLHGNIQGPIRVCHPHQWWPAWLWSLWGESGSENGEKVGKPLTCSLLHEHNLGVSCEVLARENHLLASVDQAAVHVLSLHHRQLVGRALG